MCESPVPDDHADLKSQVVLSAVDNSERPDAERMLIDTERLAIIGEMAATVAHEIAQPLQVISIAGASARMELADARDNGTQPDQAFLQAKLERIHQQVFRANRIVDELRAFVRSTSCDVAAPFDPMLSVQAALDLTQHVMAKAGVEVRTHVDGFLPALIGHAGRFEQVLVNLINNARDAGARTINLAVGARLRNGRRFIRLTVDDDGPGIAPEILGKLFEEFVTTKPRGKGTGLGLRVCRRIIEQMHGTISASNRKDGGAHFRVLLPAAVSVS
jgi:signal transduction histidine kinase